MTATHAITKLTLENFRNYQSLSLVLEAKPVVLRGMNGAGKTNILEAISLLAPGRGLRSAKLREMDRIVASRESSVASKEEASSVLPPPNGGRLGGGLIESNRSESAPLPTSPRWGEGVPWVVAAEVTSGEETHFIGTGRDGESLTEKRIIKINGEKVRGHAQLASHVCVQWLTPSMDQVFIEGGAARRKLLDRIVFGFVPEHAARVATYETAMRERNKLLSDRARADPYWLSILEQQMAEQAIAITIARLETLSRLHHELTEDIANFPRAILSLEGQVETWLATENISALDAEKMLAERLMESRNLDAARGRCSIGPQRSELHVIHSIKNMAAEQCSTGEQKALLLSMILAAARARMHWCNVPPILLLDEVIAHLDVDKRASLFDLIRQCRIQAWMTGTDAADFKGLEGFSTCLEIDDGTVKM